MDYLLDTVLQSLCLSPHPCPPPRNGGEVAFQCATQPGTGNRYLVGRVTAAMQGDAAGYWRLRRCHFDGN